jgi:hypothetical protein
VNAVTSILSAMSPSRLDDYLDRADTDAAEGVPGAIDRGEIAVTEITRRRRPQARFVPKGAA